MPWMTHAEPPARDVTRREELRHDVADGVDGDGEADALALRVDGRVDADDLAAQVEERPAAVAGVDAGVGLDEVVVGAGADRAALGADDAHRHRVAEAEGVADGDDVLADAQRLARAERGDGQIGWGVLELEDGDVEAHVLADDLRPVLAVVGELHLHLVGVVDHVRVGHDVTLRVDQEARAERLLLLDLVAVALALALVPGDAASLALVEEGEEIPEAGEAEVPAGHVHFVHGRDVHDGGSHPGGEGRDVRRAGEDRRGRERRGGLRDGVLR